MTGVQTCALPILLTGEEEEGRDDLIDGRARRNVSTSPDNQFVKERRIGGATYQVPTEVRLERQQTLALRWLVNYTRERKEYGMVEKLAAELIAASNNEGATVKKKEDTYRMAEANRAFAHYKY